MLAYHSLLAPLLRSPDASQAYGTILALVYPGEYPAKQILCLIAGMVIASGCCIYATCCADETKLSTAGTVFFRCECALTA
jgi:hypothetical protein